MQHLGNPLAFPLFGLGQLGCQPLQLAGALFGLGGAFGHLALQRLVQLPQLLLGVLAGGDIRPSLQDGRRLILAVAVQEPLAGDDDGLAVLAGAGHLAFPSAGLEERCPDLLDWLGKAGVQQIRAIAAHGLLGGKAVGAPAPFVQ